MTGNPAQLHELTPAELATQPAVHHPEAITLHGLALQTLQLAPDAYLDLV